MRRLGVLFVLLALLVGTSIAQNTPTPEPTIETPLPTDEATVPPPATSTPEASWTPLPTNTATSSPTSLELPTLITTSEATESLTEPTEAATAELSATSEVTVVPDVTPTLSPEPLVTPIFSDTFDQVDSNSTNWIFSAGWAYHAIPTGQALRVYNSSAPMIWNGDPIADVVVEAQFVVNYGTAFLSVRQNGMDGYAVSLNQSGFIALTRNGVVQQEGQVTPSTPDQWRTVRLSVLGNVIRVSVDGFPVLTYVDGSPLPAGKVTFNAEFTPLAGDVTPYPPVNTVLLDNVVISVPEGTLSATATSTASGSLTEDPSVTGTGPSETVTVGITPTSSWVEPEWIEQFSETFEEDLTHPELMIGLGEILDLGNNHAIRPLTAGDFTNIAVESTDTLFQLKTLINSGELQLALRQGDTTGYIAHIAADGQVNLFYGEQLLATSLLTENPANQWLDVRFVAVSSRFQLSINGNVVLTYTDLVNLPNLGTIGFAGEGDIWVDDLLVSTSQVYENEMSQSDQILSMSAFNEIGTNPWNEYDYLIITDENQLLKTNGVSQTVILPYNTVVDGQTMVWFTKSFLSPDIERSRIAVECWVGVNGHPLNTKDICIGDIDEDLNITNLHNLTSTPAIDEELGGWSPDGLKLLWFYSNSTFIYNIVNQATQPFSRIYPAPRFPSDPRVLPYDVIRQLVWGPDNKIYFVAATYSGYANDHVTHNIYRVSSNPLGSDTPIPVTSYVPTANCSPSMGINIQDISRTGKIIYRAGGYRCVNEDYELVFGLVWTNGSTEHIFNTYPEETTNYIGDLVHASFGSSENDIWWTSTRGELPERYTTVYITHPSSFNSSTKVVLSNGGRPDLPDLYISSYSGNYQKITHVAKDPAPYTFAEDERLYFSDEEGIHVSNGSSINLVLTSNETQLQDGTTIMAVGQLEVSHDGSILAFECRIPSSPQDICLADIQIDGSLANIQQYFNASDPLIFEHLGSFSSDDQSLIWLQTLYEDIRQPGSEPAIWWGELYAVPPYYEPLAHQVPVVLPQDHIITDLNWGWGLDEYDNPIEMIYFTLEGDPRAANYAGGIYRVPQYGSPATLPLPWISASLFSNYVSTNTANETIAASIHLSLGKEREDIGIFYESETTYTYLDNTIESQYRLGLLKMDIPVLDPIYVYTGDSALDAMDRYEAAFGQEGFIFIRDSLLAQTIRAIPLYQWFRQLIVDLGFNSLTLPMSTFDTLLGDEQNEQGDDPEATLDPEATPTALPVGTLKPGIAVAQGQITEEPQETAEPTQEPTPEVTPIGPIVVTANCSVNVSPYDVSPLPQVLGFQGQNQFLRYSRTIGSGAQSITIYLFAQVQDDQGKTWYLVGRTNSSQALDGWVRAETLSTGIDCQDWPSMELALVLWAEKDTVAVASTDGNPYFNYHIAAVNLSQEQIVITDASFFYEKDFIKNQNFIKDKDDPTKYYTDPIKPTFDSNGINGQYKSPYTWSLDKRGNDFRIEANDLADSLIIKLLFSAEASARPTITNQVEVKTANGVYIARHDLEIPITRIAFKDDATTPEDDTEYKMIRAAMFWPMFIESSEGEMLSGLEEVTDINPAYGDISVRQRLVHFANLHTDPGGDYCNGSDPFASSQAAGELLGETTGWPSNMTAILHCKDADWRLIFSHYLINVFIHYERQGEEPVNFLYGDNFGGSIQLPTYGTWSDYMSCNLSPYKDEFSDVTRTYTNAKGEVIEVYDVLDAWSAVDWLTKYLDCQIAQEPPEPSDPSVKVNQEYTKFSNLLKKVINKVTDNLAVDPTNGVSIALKPNSDDNASKFKTLIMSAASPTDCRASAYVFNDSEAAVAYSTHINNMKTGYGPGLPSILWPTLRVELEEDEENGILELGCVSWTSWVFQRGFQEPFRR